MPSKLKKTIIADRITYTAKSMVGEMKQIWDSDQQNRPAI